MVLQSQYSVDGGVTDHTKLDGELGGGLELGLRLRELVAQGRVLGGAGGEFLLGGFELAAARRRLAFVNAIVGDRWC